MISEYLFMYPRLTQNSNIAKDDLGLLILLTLISKCQVELVWYWR